MDRYDQLEPKALVASINSMPRRWKEAMWVPPEENIDDYFSVETDKGSVAEHMGAAIAQLRVLRGAIRTTTYNVPEPLEPEVLTAVANQGSGPWPKNAKSGLAELGEEIEALKAELDLISTRDWQKTAPAGDRSITLMALAQGTTRVAADRLSIAERLVRSLAD